MGTFGKSFSRELGKNTGKWASNKVFGKTGHATPHRIVRGTEGKNPSSNASIEKDKLELEKEKLRTEERRRQEEQLEKIRHLNENKIEQLETIKFSKSEDEITDILSQLKLKLKSGKWGLNETDGVSNPLMNAYLVKFEEGVFALSTVNNNSVYLKKYSKDLKAFKKKKFIGQYGILIIVLIAILIGLVII